MLFDLLSFILIEKEIKVSSIFKFISHIILKLLLLLENVTDGILLNFILSKMGVGENFFFISFFPYFCLTKNLYSSSSNLNFIE